MHPLTNAALARRTPKADINRYVANTPSSPRGFSTRAAISGPGFDRVFLDRLGEETEPKAGRAGKHQPPALGLELAVDEVAEIEHLIVGEELDEIGVRRAGDQMDVEIVEPVGGDGNAEAGRLRGDAAEVCDCSTEVGVGLQYRSRFLLHIIF